MINTVMTNQEFYDWCVTLCNRLGPVANEAMDNFHKKNKQYRIGITVDDFKNLKLRKDLETHLLKCCKNEKA